MANRISVVGGRLPNENAQIRIRSDSCARARIVQHQTDVDTGKSGATQARTKKMIKKKFGETTANKKYSNFPPKKNFAAFTISAATTKQC